VNPTPGAQVSDSETLRSYLALREQDVAVLSGQVRSSQERIQQLETLLKMEKARSTELTHVVSRQEQKITHYDQEKQVELDVLGRQIEDMDSQLKDRTDKARSIEAKLRLTMEEVGKVKERVRVDIRRIRVREKELESQLEVLKKDSSALLQARDEKILELKRKLDLLEFNMELVQEQFNKEKQSADDLKSRLKDAAQVMKQANGLLEQ
jgi:chromosome segregation ATPase